MRVLAIFSALLSVGFSNCYLEDANADCAVCWKTILGVTKMSTCDALKVELTWVVQPPEQMFELTDYVVKWKVSTPGLTVKENDVPHANIHSCLANRGACTPFVANSPGLATHTAAIKETLELDDDGTYGQYFETKVNLKHDQYTIIAHTRLFVLEGGAEATKYDMAIGISRTVALEDVTSSTSSIITAAVAGGCLALIIVAVIFAARSGKIKLEAIMVSILNGAVIGIVSLLVGLGDVIAFTFTLVNLYQNPTAATADVLPIALMILCIGWIISLTKATHDLKRLYDNFYLGGQRKSDKFARLGAEYLAKESVREDRKMRRQSSTTALQAVAIQAGEGPLLGQVVKLKMSQVNKSKVLLAAATDLVQTNRKIKTLFMVVLTLFLEQIPLCAVSMFLLVKSDEVIVADGMTLLISSVILGANTIRLLSFPSLVTKKKELLQNFTDAEYADPPDQSAASTIDPQPAVVQARTESPRTTAANQVTPV